ncbi:D-xylose transport system permease protein [Tistlia consotensis]|uniref:Xylose transport system permease protein XylH n=1 Tax=Tistlia consotensis USBA 355 TaxID=560819 RepID=A0A1Y6CP90_9PROT|nr:sugar ABC transporter permease [Tistlia consotensis]SMF81343.1 D-xylose transport system permease protein [Tistlia consotensis USBA 355]SNS22841.1 D-xylose transport system permease protein [Tistlia consotensis]
MKSLSSLLAKTELSPRLVGMLAVLAAIWIGFDLVTDGLFVTPRNLYNLSVQTASVAVMATGMVFVIVMRHIDLSVGSLLGVLAMVMGVVQTQVLPSWLGFENPATWMLTLAAGLLLGLAIGGLQGYVIGFLGVPAFIVTLGGLLVWRGAAWWVTQGQTVAPLDSRFVLLGGGPGGTLGATWSWVAGGLAMAAALLAMARSRRGRRKHGFPLRPLWAEALVAGLLVAAIAGTVLVLDAYEVPQRAAERIWQTRGLGPLPEGYVMVHGLAISVVIVVVIAIVMTVVGRSTRFGRYVYATGGNPDAAQLAGIDTRLLTVKVFALMGALCAVSAAIASARLQSAANDLGTLDELRVIAAAVIGGTSLAGGVGTIYGAIIGALVMQSLQSGMAMVGVTASLQSIVIGVVLVLAVFVDQLYRRGREE